MRKSRRQISAVAHNFDIVHSQYGFACALVTIGATDAPSLITVRGNDWNLHSETYHWHWLHRFRTVEELSQALRDFVHRFNNHWIIGRIGYRTPAAHRRILLGEAA